MDRGIPTEATLALMRASNPPVQYLVGTPKGRLTKLERSFLTKPWAAVREQVTVKLLNHDGELYVLARSAGRQDKERAMRRRRLKRLCKRLQELQRQTLTRDALLLKLGAAKKAAGRAYGLVSIQVPTPDQAVTAATFTFALNRKRLRLTRRREGRYRLRSNLTSDDPVQLWTWYIQLTEIEIYQSWCLHRAFIPGWERCRRWRRGRAAPSGGVRCAGRAGAPVRWRRPTPATGGGRHARPGGPAASLCATNRRR